MNKPKLFEIQQDFQSLLSKVVEQEGELTEEQAQALEINEQNFVEKSANYALVIKQLGYDESICNKELERIQHYKEALIKKRKFLISRLVEAMEQRGIDEVKDPRIGTFKLRKSTKGKVDIESVYLLTDDCFKTTKTPDLTAIRKKIENGEVVLGAKIVYNNSLIVK